jgi:hypothetical protein
MEVPELLGKINQFVLNPIIRLAFAIALIVFFWGIVQFINSETADSKRDEGKKKIFYGLFGMFIMFSAFGLIKLILNSFGISGGGREYLGL